MRYLGRGNNNVYKKWQIFVFVAFVFYLFVSFFVLSWWGWGSVRATNLYPLLCYLCKSLDNEFYQVKSKSNTKIFSYTILALPIWCCDAETVAKCSYSDEYLLFNGIIAQTMSWYYLIMLIVITMGFLYSLFHWKIVLCNFISSGLYCLFYTNMTFKLILIKPWPSCWSYYFQRLTH